MSFMIVILALSASHTGAGIKPWNYIPYIGIEVYKSMHKTARESTSQTDRHAVR